MVSLRLLVLALLLSVCAIQTCAEIYQDKFNDDQQLSDRPIRRFLIPKISEKSLIYRIIKSLKIAWDLVKRLILPIIKNSLGSFSKRFYTKRPYKYWLNPKRKRLFQFRAFPHRKWLYPNRIYKQRLYPQRKQVYSSWAYPQRTRLNPNRAYTQRNREYPQRNRAYPQRNRAYPQRKRACRRRL